MGTWHGYINVPFVYLDDSHAEQRYHANDDGCDYDAHDDGHVPPIDGGEHLSGNDATDDAVPNHKDSIQEGDQLRRPVSHYISGHNLERSLIRSHRLRWGSSVIERKAYQCAITAFSTPCTRICSAYGSQGATKYRQQHTIHPTQTEDQWAQKANSQVVYSDVYAEPQDPHLSVSHE